MIIHFKNNSFKYNDNMIDTYTQRFNLYIKEAQIKDFIYL